MRYLTDGSSSSEQETRIARLSRAGTAVTGPVRFDAPATEPQPDASPAAGASAAPGSPEPQISAAAAQFG